MINRIGIVYSLELNKRFISKISVGSRVRHEIPKESSGDKGLYTFPKRISQNVNIIA